jgi:peptidyl-prolyl cis-trans isomerase A (cyclophilin A)
MHRFIAPSLAAFLLTACAAGTDLVLFETELGDFQVRIETTKAPITAANFLRYVDDGFYDGGAFNRAVRLDNQRRSDILIEVVQAGGRRGQRSRDPILLERTNQTGLRHLDGTISMARGTAADSGSSAFFICINDQPTLDYGGLRNEDGQGFAAFGRVVQGMDVVRAIQASETSTEGNTENLTPPIGITAVKRIQ